MAREDALHVLSFEFKLWGVKFEHRMTGSSHVELRWQVTPDKQVRSYFIANTSSDWRGTLNARAEIRRLFRADGLNLKEVVKRPPKPVLHKALEVPTPVEKDSDQIKMLRAVIADLTDLVLDMATKMQTFVSTQITPPPVEELPNILAFSAPTAPVIPAPEEAPAAPPKKEVSAKKHSRSIKTIDFVCDVWNTTEAIARDMGLSKAQAYMKLYYLWKHGKLEMAEGGRWRLKQSLKLVAGRQR